MNNNLVLFNASCVFCSLVKKCVALSCWNSASISKIGFCLNVDVFFFRIMTLVGKTGKEFVHNTFLPAQA